MRISSFIITILITAVLFSSCAEKNKTQDKATISFVNYLPYDSIEINGEKEAVEKRPQLYFYLADSLKPVGHYFSGDSAINKTLEIPVGENGFTGLRFNHDEKQYTFYVSPGDKLELSFSNDRNISNITFNGNAQHPALLLATSDFYKTSRGLGMFDTLKKSDTEISTIIKNYNEQFNLKAQPVTDAIKKAVAENKINATLSDALLQHIENDKLIHHVKTDSAYVMKDKYLPLENSRAMVDVILKTKGIYDIAHDYNDEGKTTIGAVDKIIASAAFEPKSKQVALLNIFTSIGYINPDKVKPNLSKIKDEKVKQQIDNILTKKFLLDLEKYKNDSLNVNIISNDENRTFITLKDWIEQQKGKVVYVDLWASWCGACRTEMPAAHRLREELKGQPVVFLYISIDENFDEWVLANENVGLEGYENSRVLVNVNHSKEMKALNIDGVPRYLIYDKNGNSVNKNAPMPSSPNTKKELLKWVNS